MQKSGDLKLVHENLYSRKKHKKIQADMRFFCTTQYMTIQSEYEQKNQSKQFTQEVKKSMSNRFTAYVIIEEKKDMNLGKC